MKKIIFLLITAIVTMLWVADKVVDLLRQPTYTFSHSSPKKSILNSQFSSGVYLFRLNGNSQK